MATVGVKGVKLYMCCYSTFLFFISFHVPVLFVMVKQVHCQVGAWPDGRCYMPPSQTITDYRVSQKQNISAGEMYSTIVLGLI